jgi:hypothetical protein
LQALTGVRYDAVEITLYIASNIGDFTSFLYTETGFGTASLKGKIPTVHMVNGTIDIKKVFVSGKPASLAS